MPLNFKFIRGRGRKTDPISRTPKNECAYIIGDVHGCLSELRDLLQKITLHAQDYRELKTRIIFLGDLIDRGPDSRGVIEYLGGYKPDFATVSFLMGNHEEVFLDVLAGNTGAIASWFTFGGKACARSYGVDNLGQVLLNPDLLRFRLQAKVPAHHREFVEAFDDYLVFGDYLCVHAGILPKVPLDRQKPQDMRWIRKRFLKYEKAHPYKVVHGHSVVEEPEIHGNRIAIDTGVYKGKPLTALFVCDDKTEFLQSDVAHDFEVS